MTGCEDLVESVRREFFVEQITTWKLLRAVRHQVFCQERSIPPGDSGIEVDSYDARSRHIVLRHRSSGELVGTVRVVYVEHDNPWASLPIQHVCDPSLLRHLPLGSTGEISRFALSRVRGLGDARSSLLLRLALMRGVLRASRDLGLTHWCVVMEPSLLRLLRTASVHFEPIGPIVDYYGKRQPSVASIDELLFHTREQYPAIWEYVTEGGVLAPSDPDRLAA